MQVVLKQAVRGLGKLGDVVAVAPGYARNYLVPKGLALVATAESLNTFEKLRASLEQKELEKLQDLDLVAKKIGELGVLEIFARASEEGKLYGAITVRDVARILQKALGAPVQSTQVRLPEAKLKNVGEFSIAVELSPDIRAQFELKILPEVSV